jgi:hypothetical protein
VVNTQYHFGVLVVNVKAKSKKRVTVSISRETKDFLDSIKHTGQSYEGLIRDLVMCWKNNDAAGGNK